MRYAHFSVELPYCFSDSHLRVCVHLLLYRKAVQVAEAVAPPALARHTSDEMVERFQTMMSWEQNDHPVVAFSIDPRNGCVGGLSILSLQANFLSKYMDRQLIEFLNQSGFELSRDWSKLTNDEGVRILRNLEGMAVEFTELEDGYVLTIDNLLKMMSIQLRLKNHLPAIVMGETGCGKSTLIRNLCIVLSVPLHTLNVHGGIEDHDIISWMEERVRIAQRMSSEARMIVFLDEINTCNCMGLFKEIVCDRTMNGVQLPHNMDIIAACNPYRLRKTTSLYGGEEMAGLAFETFNSTNHLEGVGSGINGQSISSTLIHKCLHVFEGFISLSISVVYFFLLLFVFRSTSKPGVSCPPTP